MSGNWMTVSRFPGGDQEIARLGILGCRCLQAAIIPGMLQVDLVQLPLHWRVFQFHRYLQENGGSMEVRTDLVNPEGFVKAHIFTALTMDHGYTGYVEILSPESIPEVDLLPELRCLLTQYLESAHQTALYWNQAMVFVNQHSRLWFPFRREGSNL